MDKVRSPLRRRLIVATVITAALLATAGCTWFNQTPEAEKPPEVAIDALEVPASLLPSSPYADVSSTILRATDSLPWMVAGGLAAPGEGAQPTVWTSEDGTTWTDQPVDEEFEGWFTGNLSGSDELAALGGYAWHEGEERSVLWTSDDRETWTSVDLPDDLAGFSIFEVAVEGDVVFALSSDVDRTAKGLRVDGEDATTFELPEPPEDELLNPWNLSSDGDNLLLLANTGPEGDPNPTVSYLSDDAGESWGSAVKVTNLVDYVAGAAWTGEEFVVTGGTPKSADPGAPLVPATWTSPDGRSWMPVAPTAVLEYGAERNFSEADAWFGVPLVSDGVVTAVAASNNLAFAAIFSSSSPGLWQFAGETSFNPGNGDGGTAVQLSDGTHLALIGSTGYWRLGTYAGGWADVAVLADNTPFPGPSAIVPSGDQTLLISSKANFTVEADGGWRNFSTLSVSEVDGDTVTEAAWEPERIGQLTGVRMTADESGAEVRLGSYFPPGGGVILAEGWYRSAPDAEWQTLAGFEGSGATFFDALAKTGDTWTAVGDVRPTSATSDPSHGVIWTSANGTDWTRATGEFGEGRLETGVTDVCTLPNGNPVAVGWIEESTDEYRNAVWMPDDSGVWSLVDIGELGTRSGSAYDCATGEDGVVVSASHSGRDTLQFSTNGTEWEQVFRAERGISIGEPVAVSGGFAANGSWSRDEFSGPVVWLSADGEKWTAVSVESVRDGSTTHVAPYGDDLLVTMNGRTGHPVSVIRDIEKVIADHTG